MQSTWQLCALLRFCYCGRREVCIWLDNQPSPLYWLQQRDREKYFFDPLNGKVKGQNCLQAHPEFPLLRQSLANPNRFLSYQIINLQRRRMPLIQSLLSPNSDTQWFSQVHIVVAECCLFTEAGDRIYTNWTNLGQCLRMASGIRGQPHSMP